MAPMPSRYYRYKFSKFSNHTKLNLGIIPVLTRSTAVFVNLVQDVTCSAYSMFPPARRTPLQRLAAEARGLPEGARGGGRVRRRTVELDVGLGATYMRLILAVAGRRPLDARGQLVEVRRLRPTVPRQHPPARRKLHRVGPNCENWWARACSVAAPIERSTGGRTRNEYLRARRSAQG